MSRKRVVLSATFIVSLMSLQPAAAADNLPAFCEYFAPEFLSGLEAPYGIRKGPDGTTYCEGILPRRIATRALRILSVKQEQAETELTSLDVGKTLTITWCHTGNSEPATRIQLRAIKLPSFGLDAESTKQFSWPTEAAFRAHLSWPTLAANALRHTILKNHEQDVFVPVRIGEGCTTTYSFLVYSTDSIALSQALIEPTQAGTAAVVVKPTLRAGPVRSIYEALVSFQSIPPGTYRVTLGEDPAQSGRTTEPIYVFHGGCHGQSP